MRDGRTRDEFAVINPSAPLGPGQSRLGRWKVTARFTLRTKDGDVPCVRLRFGSGPSEYFTDDEFKRLFKLVRDP